MQSTQAKHESPVTSKASLRNQRSILCIEPTGEICLLMGMMLPKNQIQIHIHNVPKIVEAFHFLESEHPDLIIIENNFAEKEIASQISVIRGRAPFSKILMVSCIDAARSKALAAGVDRFLAKPFTKAALMDAVSDLLSYPLT